MKYETASTATTILKIKKTKLSLHPLKTTLKIMNPNIEQTERLLLTGHGLFTLLRKPPPDHHTDHDDNNRNRNDNNHSLYRYHPDLTSA